jgi:hypothetical protein
MLPRSAVGDSESGATTEAELAARCRSVLLPLTADSFFVRKTVWQGDASGDKEIVVPVYLLRGNTYVFSILTASGTPVQWVLRDRENILTKPLAVAAEKEGKEGKEGKEEAAEPGSKPGSPILYQPPRSSQYFLHMKLPKASGKDRIAVTYACQ